MNGLLEQTLYHSFLKVAACVLAFVLVFDSGLLFPSTADISSLAQQHMANVIGVTVGVAPNEVNQLTARITELETELEAKERLIAVDVRQRETVGGIDTSTFILSIILFILLVLIVLNYVLDFLRVRKEAALYETTTSQVA
jgi:putative N-acetylmannosamine-6-phosphate epimerase